MSTKKIAAVTIHHDGDYMAEGGVLETQALRLGALSRRPPTPAGSTLHAVREA